MVLPKYGLLIAEFEPLTNAHLIDINHACGLVDTLHIVVLPSQKKHKLAPTLSDKARWLQVSVQDFGFVHIHTLNSLHIDTNPNISYHHTGFNPTSQFINQISQTLNITQPVVFYHSSVDTPTIANCLPLNSHTTHDTINLISQFDKIALSARYFYTQKICIIGGESSGKTTLVHKLKNHYNASYALEMGRAYTHTHLGGTEIGLQYSDYKVIAVNHADAIFKATQNATAFATFIDTDFVTTQAFCQEYENKKDPVVASLIDNLKMDLTIMLDNNVKWVADGMRRLGDESDRSRFENRLIQIANQHNIPLHIINDTSYHDRYLKAVTLIDNFLQQRQTHFVSIQADK